MSKIFISHSSNDKEIVNSFVDNILQLGMKLDKNDIFCTSSEGMGVKSGEEWRDRIKDEITSARLILIMITPNYKASEICLNEMGAAWITEARVIPLIIGEITYQSAGVIAKPKQIEKLDDNGLDRLYEAIKDLFPSVKEHFNVSVWGSKKRKFIQETGQHLKSNPFPKIYSQKEFKSEMDRFKQLQHDFDDLVEKNEILSEEIEKLKECKDANEVFAIEQKYERKEIVEEFEKAIKEMKDKLDKVPAVVRTIIYNSRYGRNLKVNMLFQEELRKAEAQNFIEDDGGIYIPIYKKKTMNEIDTSLESLSCFLLGLDEVDREKLEEKYETIDMNDLDFWTDVIGVTMDYIT